MGAEIFLKSSNMVEAKKSVSVSDATKLFKAIEQQSGWSVLEMIRQHLREQCADGFTISRDKPRCRLSVRRCFSNLSIRFEKERDEIRVLIPDMEISTR